LAWGVLLSMGGIIGGILTGYLYSRKIFKPLFLMDLILPFLLLGQAIGRFGNFANGEAHGVPTITPPSIIFRVKNVFPDFWQTVKHTFNLPDGTNGMNILYEMVKTGKTLAVNFEGKVYYLKEYVPWGISFPPKYNPPAYMEFGLLPVHPTFFYEMILNFIGAFILIKLWKNDYMLGKGVITGLYLIFYGVIRGVVTTFRADDLMIGFIRAPHLVSIILIIAGFLFVKYGVKDDISHGVTKILHAISQRKSRIKPHNIYSSLVAGTITIGFGGSVGAEAPIVLTGSAYRIQPGKVFQTGTTQPDDPGRLWCRRRHRRHFQSTGGGYSFCD